jgi:hypothetical protein
VHTLDRFPNVFRAGQTELDVNSADDKYAVFGFDFTASFRFKSPLTGIDFTRFQRAPEGSEHSAGCRSDYIIDSCRMRLFEFGFVDAIVFGDRAMNAEQDWITLTG